MDGPRQVGTHCLPFWANHIGKPVDPAVTLTRVQVQCTSGSFKVSQWYQCEDASLMTSSARCFPSAHRCTPSTEVICHAVAFGEGPRELEAALHSTMQPNFASSRAQIG